MAITNRDPPGHGTRGDIQSTISTILPGVAFVLGMVSPSSIPSTLSAPLNIPRISSKHNWPWPNPPPQIIIIITKTTYVHICLAVTQFPPAESDSTTSSNSTCDSATLSSCFCFDPRALCSSRVQVGATSHLSSSCRRSSRQQPLSYLGPVRGHQGVSPEAQDPVLVRTVMKELPGGRVLPEIRAWLIRTGCRSSQDQSY